MLGLISAVLLLAVVAGQNPDLITYLPGAPNVTFNQYSGYIVVNESHGRNMFYWFVESQNKPATDPVVLWLNGGPGCSSLGGFLSENGPFYVNTDGKTLRLNPSAWNTIANVIYLESPSGVGFSTSQTPSDYTTGDYQTAQDSVIFMQKWLTMYPQFQNNPFWITGESYGGHYVPNLAKAILQANTAGGTPKINLAGFQVGNAWTNAELDNEGAVDMWYSHAIISQETYNGFYAHCDFSTIGPLSAEAQDAKCNQYQYEAFDVDMQAINIYQIYYDICLTGQRYQNQAQKLMDSISDANPRSPFPKGRFSADKQGRLGDQMPDPDPCVDTHMQQYLNIPSVQQAIHAQPTAWVDCSSIVNYSRSDLLSSMIPVYQWLLTNSNIRMLVYSGDVDGIVPVTGTRSWLAYMNMTVSEIWRPWFDSEQQTGGFTMKYKYGTNPNGLTFASVRDAGHMVPWVQPGRSHDLFSRFLNNQPI